MNANDTQTTTTPETTPTFAQWNAARVLEGLEGPKGDLMAMRGVCAIFRRQTEVEKRSGSTIASNGVGFSSAHARVGTKLAQWMSMGQGDGIFRRSVGGTMRFQGIWMTRVEVCKTLCRVYRGQLADIANASLAKRAVAKAASAPKADFAQELVGA